MVLRSPLALPENVPAETGPDEHDIRTRAAEERRQDGGGNPRPGSPLPQVPEYEGRVAEPWSLTHAHGRDMFFP